MNEYLFRPVLAGAYIPARLLSTDGWPRDSPEIPRDSLAREFALATLTTCPCQTCRVFPHSFYQDNFIHFVLGEVAMKTNVTEWFSQVGVPLMAPSVVRVHSWNDALKFCADEVVRWCSIEAKTLLYNHVSELEPARHSHWNEIAKGMAPQVEGIVCQVIEAKRIPHLSDAFINHLRSQVIGAMLEDSFDDVFHSTLFRQQIAFYNLGRFPCGMTVNAVSDFPSAVQYLVF